MSVSVSFPWKQARTVKVEGKDNNLLELIAADPAFNLTLEDLQKIHGSEEIYRTCQRADRELYCNKL